MNTIRKLSAAALSAITLASAMPAMAHDRYDDRGDGRRYEQERWDHGQRRGWERQPVARRVVVEQPVYVEQRVERQPIYRGGSDATAGILIGGIIGAIIGSQVLGR